MIRRLVVVFAFALGCADDGSDAPMGALDAAVAESGASDAVAPGCVVPAAEQVEVTSAVHVVGEVAYASLPPAGGDHNGCWARWGVHDSEIADERFVHNLEHGGVVFLYHCPDGCPAEVAALKSFVTGRDFALLTPYAALPARFGAVAWGYRLLSNCFDMAAFERFFVEHRDNAPESITSNPSSSCM